MKTLMTILLAASLSACMFDLEDAIPGGGSDGQSDSDTGNDPGPGPAPEACVVGLWTVSGDTGVGNCYSLFGIIIEDSVLFEQDGDQVSASLYNGSDTEYLADAGYDETANGCSAGFQISVEGPDRFDLYYAVSATSSGSVFGTAVLSANIDGTSCEQAWEVVGVLQK